MFLLKKHEPIDYTLTLGTVTKVAIENLIAQMNGQSSPQEQLNLAVVEPGHVAVIAVSPGMGISRIFASLGLQELLKVDRP